MKIIESVRIRHYRSIINTTRGNITHLPVNDLNVIVGSNDAGKSNFLRALNLFFNHDKEYFEDFDFWKEFSIQRHGVQREVSRIEVELIINPPRKQYFKNNGQVKWTKVWKNSRFPEEHFEYVNGSIFLTDSRSSYFKWLKKIKFRYVPAIKGKAYFNNLMFDLYEILQNDTNQLESTFNKSVKLRTQSITQEIGNKLGLDNVLQYRGTFRDLFNTLEFGSPDGKLMLEQRGDGVQVRHIPIVLQNIAETELESRGKREPCINTIWGFEEPENNLEFAAEKKLADHFIEYISRIHLQRSNYPHDEGIQIFLTTHSPVFYTLGSLLPEKVNTFFAEKTGKGETEIKAIPKDEKGKSEVESKMGLAPLLSLSSTWQKLNDKYAIQENKLKDLESRVKELNRPLLITEGKTDTAILNTAWSKLYPNEECPFDILPADTSPSDAEGGNAGAGVLTHFANSVRPNDNIRMVLWDYDYDGIKGFKLNKNFDLLNGYSHVKVHKNKKSFGIILPKTEGLEDYYDAENLPIEFLFEEQDFDRKDETGLGLFIKKEKLIKTFGKRRFEQEIDDRSCAKIGGNKVAFAENVVPTLPSESFRRFVPLFDTIKHILSSFSQT